MAEEVHYLQGYLGYLRLIGIPRSIKVYPLRWALQSYILISTIKIPIRDNI